MRRARRSVTCARSRKRRAPPCRDLLFVTRESSDEVWMPRAQALNNVNPAAVLRPSGTVVSIKCVEKIIKKDMLDPFTGELIQKIIN